MPLIVRSRLPEWHTVFVGTDIDVLSGLKVLSMETQRPRLFFSLFFPVLFVILLWMIWLYEQAFHTSLAEYGIFPRTEHGLIGIFAAPLLHADYRHLLANTLPLLILGVTLFYFYRSIAFRVFGWIYIMTGIWVWTAARSSYHIGASGILYGLISFLFFSGIIRRDTRLMAISLFVVFLYGSAIWGILPLKQEISFESHLLGAVAGLITAWHFRREGPQARVYDLGTDEENEGVDVSGLQENELPPPVQPGIHIVYTFVPEKKPEAGPDDAPDQ